jgi:hypothetical protein
MRMFLSSLLFCLIAVAVGLYHLGNSADVRISREIRLSATPAPEPRPPAPGPDDYMEGAERSSRVHQRTVREILHKEGHQRTPGVRFWSMGNPLPIAATALGTDADHHFVNSFLVGFAPFEAEDPWVPLYALSLRLKYRLDQTLFGVPDVWQTSEQAYFNSVGDCEDHSILLADWLIEMGYDARVVIGDQRGQGHAWVVVFGKSEVYLVEATSKRKIKNWKHVPLARMATDYHGRAMFNRENLWVYTSRAPSPDYHSPAWRKASRFVKERL